MHDAAGPARVRLPLSARSRWVLDRALPVLTMILAVIVIWYLAAAVMNTTLILDQAERLGKEVEARAALVEAMSHARPQLPAPHQVAIEIWSTTVEQKLTSPRNILFHAWVTLSATLLGFLIGSLLGILLAISILHSRAMDYGVMPFVVASQTIPILAIAPMIIVILNSVGLAGLIPKSIISAYLSFFPVAVGMVTGLRCPDRMQIDLMHTYNATPVQILWKLRTPVSIPFLFSSLKIAIAASLVGAIVGELPTGAVAGLGARMLTGSYYGQTIQIWSALITAALLAATLVGLITLIQRRVMASMGMMQ